MQERHCFYSIFHHVNLISGFEIEIERQILTKIYSTLGIELSNITSVSCLYICFDFGFARIQIQKDLQLRLEKQGEYLKEFLDEQQKSDSSGVMQVHDELLKLNNSKSDSERQAKKGNSTILLLPEHKSASENSNSEALRGRKRFIREDE